jgi:lysozyme
MIDQTLVDFVKKEEGFTRCALWDYHQWTNGYGTRAHHTRECITEAEAERRLLIELEAAQAAVVHFQPTMPDGVLNALTDLTFNAGSAWMHAGLGDEVKAGNWAAAKEHLLQYDEAGGRVLSDLKKRRLAEASWFPAGETVA